jgi:chemotaxis protein methyltransferase CheR
MIAQASPGPELFAEGHKLSDKDFKRLSSWIVAELGIRMPETKRVMLESRLAKRVKICGMAGFGPYLDYAFSSEGAAELVNLIDAVTTNKTDFFREADHFDFLSQRVLPELAAPGRKIRFWSAGCSTGEEPYTLAMVLEEYRMRDPDFSYGIVASDISTRVLEAARNGVYDAEKAEPVPLSMKKRYMLKSKDPGRNQVRMKPEMRAKVEFKRVNLMDASFGFREPFHVVFCRNVIIYFDRPTQEALLARICHNVVPGGYVFLGHSETIAGFDTELVGVSPTVYRLPAVGARK